MTTLGLTNRPTGKVSKFFRLVGSASIGSSIVFIPVGTWSEDPGHAVGAVCSKCHRSFSCLVPPLILDIVEHSRARINDCMWTPAYGILTSPAAAALQALSGDLDFKLCSIVKTAKRYSTILEGIQLYWLRARKSVHLDLVASGLPLNTECQECGRRDVPYRQSGLVIRSDQCQGVSAFELHDYYGPAVYVDESLAKKIAALGLMNMECQEVGIIEDVDAAGLCK